jgi:hypothetical protein
MRMRLFELCCCCKWTWRFWFRNGFTISQDLEGSSEREFNQTLHTICTSHTRCLR